MRSRSSRTQLSLSLAALVCGPIALIAIAACNKPPAAAVFDAAPPPAATDAAPTVLVPLDEDAGSPVDAAVAVVVKHTGGPGLSNNQARAKQCCSAIRTQAKTLGASPEANMLTGFAAQCDMVALQIGPTTGGQAPEFAAIRQLLKGHNIPAVCSGL
jgi:hypothetical protein